MSELIGQTIGQYQITAVLGEGGMATVYRAHQLSIKRDVAIKVIESKLARNPEFVKRFEREAQTVASLDHPHILKVFDFGQQGDLIYLVMELKTGGTLAKQIATRQLSLERVAELLTQIGAALDYAHGRGIIHRDLKPQNVLLDDQGNAFLTDFGIAKLLQPDYTSLTQTGAAMGTPAYMSPEQWQGRMLDARSDLYALGIMLYEMLTGQIPFRADTPAGMMFAHLQETPPPLHEVRSDLPRYLEPVIATALSKSPDARFQTAKSLADAFRDALNGKPFAMPSASSTPSEPRTLPPAPPPAMPARRGSRLPFVAAGALVLILVAGGLYLASQRNSPTPTASGVSASDTPQTQVAALATTGEATAMVISTSPAAAPSSTETPRPASHTFTVTTAPTHTPTASPTATTSFTPSKTATATLTLDIVQIVASLDAQATAAVRATNIAGTATAIIGKTLTATSWTKTPTTTPSPTPNITASVNAYLTQRAVTTGTAEAVLNQTATATMWTRTPTPTRTFTPVPTAIPTLTTSPVPTVISNQQWTPQVKMIDGVEMVLVPSGCFMIGNSDGYNDEKPVHRVCITQPFYLDRYEVTNVQFDQKGGQAKVPSMWTNASRPRETISWQEANAYCELRGGYLPTEAEWEYAARGPNNLIYPWGNSFYITNVVYNDNSNKQTANVGSRPLGRSWVGAYDMSGNVWEWVADWYGSYPSTPQNDPMNNYARSDRVTRGGAWTSSIINITTTVRGRVDAAESNSRIGVRCARSLDGSARPSARTVSTPNPTIYVTQNSDWQAQVVDIDGVEMVLVPAGCFRMGNESGYADEQPVHLVCITKPFYLDRFEVTNSQFAAKSGKAAQTSKWLTPQRPRERITWTEADTYCRQRGGSLPTEAEWEFAARGPNNLDYPWGNTFVVPNSVYSGNAGKQTDDVGADKRAAGKSWVGAYDMSGNVWEWVADWYGSYPSTPQNDPMNNYARSDRVTRGGAWTSTITNISTTVRGRVDAAESNDHIGVRCARSLDGSTRPSARTVSTPNPTIYVTRNSDWQEQIITFDGVEMVIVPSGCFQMGSQYGYGDEQPVHLVCITRPFYLDRFEVTNSQFAVQSGKAAQVSRWIDPQRPRERITWREADAYCRQRGGRLPTEAEWEFAVRGPDNLTYPWGNTFVVPNAVYSINASNHTADVGADQRVSGKSWVGAYDMSGNVWEWVTDWYGTYSSGARTDPMNQVIGPSRVARGGSWASTAINLRATNRGKVDAAESNDRIGLRCARSY